MEAPQVQYATTRDGYKIAYTACGDGLPVVFLPSWTNHAQEVWANTVVGWLLAGLTERHRVVNYDARGMGMSTRGLQRDVSLESFFLDLEAVVERLGLKRFVLIGSHNSALLAARYAVRFPDRVAALVLNNSGLAWPGGQLPSLWEDMARQSWEAFLYSLVPRSYPPEAATNFQETIARWTSQEDYVATLDVWRGASLEDVVDQLQTPTLVLKPRLCPCARVECSVELAQLLPNGRLVLLEGDTPFGEPTHALDAIESFLAELGLTGDNLDGALSQTLALPAALSARQAQVLQLIAEGKTNGEIADALVISLRTVERHVAELYAKIGARNRVEAAAFAMGQLAKA
jgi:pimeloyl-ACP methyl ester carboxylesterase/DNA-binding CsgD family transcriptional regulator